MDDQLGRDLISDLPLGIIEIILMFLPIRDAIRTSILSSKWRHRWNSLPHLVFEEESMGYSRTSPWEEEDELYDKCIQNFIACTLFRHQGPIHKFKLHVLHMNDFPETDQWLLFLSRKDNKELILRKGLGGCFHVPSCLYSCRSLTSLKLDGCRLVPPPPTFKGFLSLRRLILEFVKVHSSTVESIVANSPLLDHLVWGFSEPSEFSELRISAPNLKYFHLECVFREIYVRAPLLAQLSVRLDEEDDNGFEVPPLQLKHSVCNYTEFLGDFPNLVTLTGETSFIKYLSIGIGNCQHPLVFHHLKVITLWRVKFNDLDEILVVVRLLTDAVNLRELHLCCEEVKAPHIHLWDSKCLQNCTFKKLKTIKMTNFRGSLHERKLVKAFARKLTNAGDDEC